MCLIFSKISDPTLHFQMSLTTSMAQTILMILMVFNIVLKILIAPLKKTTQMSHKSVVHMKIMKKSSRKSKMMKGHTRPKVLLFSGCQNPNQMLAIRHSVDRVLPALPALSALSDLQFLQLSQLFQLSQFCQFFHSSDTLSSPSSSNFEIENWKIWESFKYL